MLQSKRPVRTSILPGGGGGKCCKVKDQYFNIAWGANGLGDHLPTTYFKAPYTPYSFSSVTISICVQVGSSSLFTTSECYTHRALQSLKVGMSWFWRQLRLQFSNEVGTTNYTWSCIVPPGITSLWSNWYPSLKYMQIMCLKLEFNRCSIRLKYSLVPSPPPQLLSLAVRITLICTASNNSCWMIVFSC